MKDIKLFITDIDGVWTDGGMYYDQQGNELKKFNTSDSAGVLFLKSLNIPVAIITGEDTQIVKRRADKLKITDCYQGVRDKLTTAKELCSKYAIKLDQVAYIGDDINDIILLKSAGLSAAPDNAPSYIKEIVDWPLPVKGGDGAFRKFVEKYLLQNNLMEKALKTYLNNQQQLNQ